MQSSAHLLQLLYYGASFSWGQDEMVRATVGPEAGGRPSCWCRGCVRLPCSRRRRSFSRHLSRATVHTDNAQYLKPAPLSAPNWREVEDGGAPGSHAGGTAGGSVRDGGRVRDGVGVGDGGGAGPRPAAGLVATERKGSAQGGGTGLLRGRLSGSQLYNLLCLVILCGVAAVLQAVRLGSI